MAVSVEIERQLGGTIIGVDEAGRGPLVGAVYAAAVSVPLDMAETLLNGAWSGVNDSKRITPKKREHLADVIKSTPNCTWAIAFASSAEIDQINILRATHLAMNRAVTEIGEKLKSKDQNQKITILVDGLPVPNLPFSSQNVIKGDAKSLLIAAASILAKTARDADCLRLERLYPGYGIAKHKGYPTPAHIEALKKLGPCPEHRRTFKVKGM